MYHLVKKQIRPITWNRWSIIRRQYNRHGRSCGVTLGQMESSTISDVCSSDFPCRTISAGSNNNNIFSFSSPSPLVHVQTRYFTSHTGGNSASASSGGGSGDNGGSGNHSSNPENILETAMSQCRQIQQDLSLIEESNTFNNNNNNNSMDESQKAKLLVGAIDSLLEVTEPVNVLSKMMVSSSTTTTTQGDERVSYIHKTFVHVIQECISCIQKEQKSFTTTNNNHSALSFDKLMKVVLRARSDLHLAFPLPLYKSLAKIIALHCNNNNNNNIVRQDKDHNHDFEEKVKENVAATTTTSTTMSVTTTTISSVSTDTVDYLVLVGTWAKEDFGDAVVQDYFTKPLVLLAKQRRLEELDMLLDRIQSPTTPTTTTTTSASDNQKEAGFGLTMLGKEITHALSYAVATNVDPTRINASEWELFNKINDRLKRSFWEVLQEEPDLMQRTMPRSRVVRQRGDQSWELPDIVSQVENSLDGKSLMYSNELQDDIGKQWKEMDAKREEANVRLR